MCIRDRADSNQLTIGYTVIHCLFRRKMCVALGYNHACRQLDGPLRANHLTARGAVYVAGKPQGSIYSNRPGIRF